MSTEPKTRDIVREIEIAATPEAVWKALTEASGLTAWFAPIAEVTPGVGGRVLLSWGPGMEGEAPISAWEPGKHLRTEDSRGRPIALDYFLEARGGKTLVRLVQSGFGFGADWDAEYDSLEKGWDVFMLNLQWYLEHQAGKPCRQIQLMRPLTASPAESWSRLTGPAWLAKSGTIANLRLGDAFDVETASGDRLRGTIDLLAPPNHFGASADNLDARFNLAIECMGGSNFLFATLLVYGRPASECDALEKRWNEALDRALG